MVRKSKKRDAIYALLNSLKTHPAAEQLYAVLKPEIPDLSLGTVYSNLAAFKKEGGIISVGVVNGKERFDGDITPHAHFICRNCDSVSDLWDVKIPEPEGFSAQGKVDVCQLSYFGICNECLNKINSTETKEKVL